MKKTTEHDIQSSIRLALSERGYFTERINVGSGFLIDKRLMAKLKSACPKLREELDKVPYFSTGAVNGRSDLSAVKDGKIYFLEVKTATGRVRPEQEKFLQVMRDRYGCKGGIVRSVEDAIKLVEGK